MDTRIRQLEAQIDGSLLLPDHPLYEQTHRSWNRMIDQRPALILVAHTAQDIVLGVRYARDVGLGVAVQLTGHGTQYPADGALLIITAHMAAVHVDAVGQTARVEAGAVWQHVLDQATPHGLAPLLGSTPHVGVVGYTLGGGIGWLGRRYGFAADHVRWIEIVTADGRLRHASRSEHSELFWGLLGGGGNFGVVTAMEFDLVPVASVYGGRLVYDGDQARDALRFFRDWAKSVPVELTSSIVTLRYPSLPELPKALRGATHVIVRAAFVGDAATGAALLQPWLDWHTPLDNTFRELPFAAIGTIANDPVEPQAAYTTNEMFGALSDDAIDIIVRYATDSATPVLVSELRHVGGAIARGDAAAIAVGNRDAQFYFQMVGPTPTPEAHAAVESYIRCCKAELQPYLHGGVYLNFLKGNEARQRVQDAYRPGTYERLRELKATYDPDGMFRYSYQLGEAPAVEA